MAGVEAQNAILFLMDLFDNEIYFAPGVFNPSPHLPKFNHTHFK